MAKSKIAFPPVSQPLFLSQDQIEDFLSLTLHSVEALILASDHVRDREELNQVIYGTCAAIRAAAEDLRAAGVDRTLLLNPDHPGFATARSSICAGEQLRQDADGEASPSVA
jgi:hypothetical protein